MKKALSRLFLLSAAVFVIGSTVDVYGGPGGPCWDEFSLPIIPLPITISSYNPPADDGDCCLLP